MSSHKECCDLMSEAIEEETIQLIHWYEHTIGLSMTRERVHIKKGYYIIDGYATGELCNENYPTNPKTPLNFCPWCRTDLVREWKNVP